MNTMDNLPCLDSDALAEKARRDLDIDRSVARDLGLTAVTATQRGCYLNTQGQSVDWRAAVEAAVAAKVSLPPEIPLPEVAADRRIVTQTQVCNETTLVAARRLKREGRNPLALNFANGLHPGGGFLHGARAQEEVLCRSSALYATLVGDPMYEAHARRPTPDSSDWAIYSPEVPVFRNDDGQPLEQPWTLSVLTCAAPYAPVIGRAESAKLLKPRIYRVLSIARAYGYHSLVLGAWGCGAFGNDPERTARDFHEALTTEFQGAFSEVIFAIVDWSPERRFLGPFTRIFQPG